MQRLYHKRTRKEYASNAYRTTTGGFTLVETLVAITILLVAIVGPMTIAARGLQTAFYAREQITAFSLAQEGVELVRATRDENALQRSNWLTNIPPGLCEKTVNPQGCGLDTRRNSFINCVGTASACQLKYDAGPLLNKRGFYNYTTGTETSFTRRMWINSLSGGREAEVTVEVSWQSGLLGSVKRVTVQSRLFNQYNNL